MACDTVAKHQLLIKLISSDLRQIIAARIEEHAHNQTLSALYSKRLTRTNLLIQLQKTFLVGVYRILLDRRHNLRLLAEQL